MYNINIFQFHPLCFTFSFCPGPHLPSGGEGPGRGRQAPEAGAGHTGHESTGGGAEEWTHDLKRLPPAPLVGADLVCGKRAVFFLDIKDLYL